MIAKVLSTAGSPDDSTIAGAMIIGSANPRYCAIVRMPAAVARSEIGNQFAGTFVEILIRNGCPLRSASEITITESEVHPGKVSHRVMTEKTDAVSTAPIVREQRYP